MKKYVVCACLDCNKPVLYKVEFIHSNDKCCQELKNLRAVKVFNDPQEAEEYFGLNNED